MKSSGLGVRAPAAHHGSGAPGFGFNSSGKATTLNSRILNFGTLSSRILNYSKILHTEKCVSACIRGQTCRLVTGPPHITHKS